MKARNSIFVAIALCCMMFIGRLYGDSRTPEERAADFCALRFSRGSGRYESCIERKAADFLQAAPVERQTARKPFFMGGMTLEEFRREKQK